jgi:hypothetical protein
MAQETDFGKNGDGSKNTDYCCHCYPNGAFNNPDETLEEMIDSCAPFLIEYGVCSDLDAAKKMLGEQLPFLKRWKQ